MRWAPEIVQAVAYDTPVPGCRVHSANLLRLWKAEAAGTASEPAKSQVCDLPCELHPAGKHRVVEGVARIWW